MSLSSVEIVKTIELDFAFMHLRSDGIFSFWAKTEEHAALWLKEF